MSRTAIPEASASAIQGRDDFDRRDVTAALVVTILLTAVCTAASAQTPPISQSPGWTRALPPGPDIRVKRIDSLKTINRADRVRFMSTHPGPARGLPPSR
jgi:hypothetical protein